MKAPLTKLIALFLALGATAARSQTLNWGSLTNSTIVDSQGTPLDETYVFEIGAFDTGFTPTWANIDEWEASWNVFDAASYAYNPGDLGYFTGTALIQDVSGYVSLFEGMGGYLWVRNSSNSENFLGRTADWTFPLIDPGCCPTGVTTWSVSDLVDDTPVWGSHDDKHGAGRYEAPGPFDLQTHFIPEPATPLLALLGCATAILRRRRTDK